MRRRWYVHKRYRQLWSGLWVQEWMVTNIPKRLLANPPGRIFPTWRAAMDHVNEQLRKAQA